MQYEDRITIQTPEGVDLELTLAGVGSRFVAALVDGLIRGALLLAVAFATGAGRELFAPTATEISPTEVIALSLAGFLLLFGYDVFFEVLASGRTPGKRWSGLRVVLVGGRPVGFVASAVRNIVRIIDFLPVFYGIGIVAATVSRNNQRLGDLAAGTLVVRELRRVEGPRPSLESAAARDELAAWDVSAVTPDELAALRRFLERRGELAGDARRRIAEQLAAALRPKIAGPTEAQDSETFLERVAAAKSLR
ncbi:MAG: RDD family protein [Actinomycetota bacterium]